MRPPVTYPATLADLELFANAAAELDGVKDCERLEPDERARLVAMVERVYDTVERLAGADNGLVFARGGNV